MVLPCAETWKDIGGAVDDIPWLPWFEPCTPEAAKDFAVAKCAGTDTEAPLWSLPCISGPGVTVPNDRALPAAALCAGPDAEAPTCPGEKLCAKSIEEKDLDAALSEEPWQGSGGTIVAGGGGFPVCGSDALPRDILLLRTGDSEICCQGAATLTVGVADPPCGALVSRTGTLALAAPCGYPGLVPPGCIAPRRRAGDCDL